MTKLHTRPGLQHLHSGGWLIEDNERTISNSRASEGKPALHSTGEPRRELILDDGEIYRLEPFLDSHRNGFAWYTAKARKQLQMLSRRQVRIQVVILLA